MKDPCIILCAFTTVKGNVKSRQCFTETHEEILCPTCLISQGSRMLPLRDGDNQKLGCNVNHVLALGTIVAVNPRSRFKLGGGVLSEDCSAAILEAP